MARIIRDDYTGEDLTNEKEGWYSIIVSRKFPGSNNYYRISNDYVAIKNLEDIPKYIKEQEKAVLEAREEDGIILTP